MITNMDLKSRGVASEQPESLPVLTYRCTVYQQYINSFSARNFRHAHSNAVLGWQLLILLC